MAIPVLDRGSSADRMRNHLRRRAITRVGMIEGDLYMLPFWRVAGQGPEGEPTFYILAAEVGDARLHRANLLPANMQPFDPAALPAGARVIPASLSEPQIAARAEGLGWRVERLEEMIHYPFWLLRIVDQGRVEGGWIDGIEGKIIHHNLKVPRPLPKLAALAGIWAAPAAGLALVCTLTDSPVAAAGALVVAAAAGSIWIAARIGRHAAEWP
jgi:hypothetical protein